MPSASTYAVFLATAIVLLLIPGPAVLYVLGVRRLLGRALEAPGEEAAPHLLGVLGDSMCAVAAGTVVDRLRSSTGIARVRRWVSGGVLLGLGILAAVWAPSRAR